MPQEITLTSLSKTELQEIITNALDTIEKLVSEPKLEINDALPKLLSIRDLCDLFKVSRVTIHTWMKQGRIPFRKVSRRVYFIQDEVMASLQNFNLATVQTFNKSYFKGDKNNGK